MGQLAERFRRMFVAHVYIGLNPILPPTKYLKIMTKEQIKKEIHYHQRIIENHERELTKLKQQLNEKENH